MVGRPTVNKYMALIIILLSSVTAALSTLPYGWAHVAATACSAAMGAAGISAGSYNLAMTKAQPQSQPTVFWPEDKP